MSEFDWTFDVTFTGDPEPDHDIIRHLANTDEATVSDEQIDNTHWLVAVGWYAQAGCELDADSEEQVLFRLAATSIQTSAAKEVSDEALGEARVNYIAMGMAGQGLMANANFMAAVALCPGLRTLAEGLAVDSDRNISRHRPKPIEGVDNPPE